MNLSLDDFLTYQNPEVIQNHAYRYQLKPEDVQQQFCDLLAWFWLSEQRLLQGKKTYFFGPLLRLDDLWHTFILHTRHYIDFSEQFFGRYYHHEVQPAGQEEELSEEALRDLLNDCFDHLGQAWVERCFVGLF